MFLKNGMDKFLLYKVYMTVSEVGLLKKCDTAKLLFYEKTNNFFIKNLTCKKHV